MNKEGTQATREHTHQFTFNEKWEILYKLIQALQDLLRAGNISKKTGACYMTLVVYYKMRQTSILKLQSSGSSRCTGCSNISEN